MKFFTQSQLDQLLANGRAQRTAIDNDGKSLDFKPVAKLFTPDGAATWLLTELDSDGLLFGLCDLGLGEPELGYVSLHELATVRGKLGLPIERDEHFEATKPSAPTPTKPASTGASSPDGVLPPTFGSAAFFSSPIAVSTAPKLRLTT